MAGERGRRRGVTWLVGVLLVLALAWCGYWYAVSRAAEVVIGRVISAVSAHGGSLSWTEQGIGGFPLSLDLRGSQVKFAYPPRSVAAGVNRVMASAPLYYPGRVTAAFVGPVVFDSPEAGIAASASWLLATAGVDVGLNGLIRASTSIDGLTVEQTGTRSPIRHLAVGHADFAAAPAAGDDYRITAAARDLTVERSDDQSYPALAGQLDLTAIHFGSGLGIDPKQAIKAWAKGGGKIRVDRIQFSAGSFTASAAGDLSLDAQGLLSGQLTLSLTGLSVLPDLAEQIRPGSRKRLQQVVGAVTAMTQPTGTGDTRKIPVLIMKGTVSVMLIPVATIPAVKL
jgi:hypothetical protein